MNAPRFLLSTALLPWPANQGNKLFMLELARSLRAVGAVTWISRGRAKDDQVRRQLESEGFRLRLDESYARDGLLDRLRRRLRSEWEARRTGVPRVQIYGCTPRMRDLMLEELAQDPEAIAVGAFWFQAPAVRLGHPGRRVLVLSDLEYHREAARLSCDPEGPLPAPARRLRRAEKASLLSCDALLCLTESDLRLARRSLESLSTTQLPSLGVWPAVIPLPANLTVPRRRQSGGPQRWLCYGHWSAEFNRAGLERFLAETWPALMRALEVPPLLRIAGADIDQSLRRKIEGNGAVAVGWVENLSAELAACDAVVIPLDYAGGLRYRMLEAMAAECPVICTPVAAEGAGAESGTHYLQAETPTEWARAWRFLEDEESAVKLARAGRAFVEASYGPASRGMRVRQVLSKTLGPTILDATPQ
jgi:hypothetical protein